jgi:hypothetical protein
MEDVMAEKCSLRNEYIIHILQPFCVKYKQERKKLTVSCLAGGGSNEQAGS